MARSKESTRAATSLSFKVQVRRAAELDLANVQVWYEAQRSGLGAEFQLEVSRVLDRLADTPLLYPVYIEMFAGRLFIAFHISSGIEFLAM